MDTKKYIIKLTPLGRYFFGGENTFGEGKGKSYNYFACSETMPQVSSIIGMLRYEILRRSGALDRHIAQEQWHTIIGEQSFSLDDMLCSDKPVVFGLISAISPVFLCDNEGRFYTPMPLDQGISYNKESGRSYYSGYRRSHTVMLDNFDHKKYCNWKQWVDEKGDALPASPFLFSSRPGIIKNEEFRESGNDEAYYKQEVVSLRKGFGFAFIFETPLDNKLFDCDRQCFVKLGADNSIFAMTVEPCERDFTFAKYFSALGNEDRCLLLGDAYLPTKTGTDFIWADSKNFRSISSKTSEQHSWKRPQKSLLFHLLKPGGVVFGDKVSIEKLLTMERLQRVGLNHYV